MLFIFFPWITFCSAFFWPFLTFALIGILCFLVAFSCIHQPEFAPICIYLVISPQVSLIPLTSPFPLASVRSTYPEKLAAYTVYQGLSTMGFFFKLVIFFFAILGIFDLRSVLHLRSLLVCLSSQSEAPRLECFLPQKLGSFKARFSCAFSKKLKVPFLALFYIFQKKKKKPKLN